MDLQLTDEQTAALLTELDRNAGQEGHQLSSIIAPE
jgi:hypothetical protein